MAADHDHDHGETTEYVASCPPTDPHERVLWSLDGIESIACDPDYCSLATREVIMEELRSTREYVAALRRAPPLAAPAPSAMATGEDEIARVREAWIVARQVVFAVRAVLEAFGERDEPHIDDHQSAALRDLRETATAYYQRNHDRSTPPAAPAAVTRATGVVPAHWSLAELIAKDCEWSVPVAIAYLTRWAQKSPMLAAALAAAASAATKGE